MSDDPAPGPFGEGETVYATDPEQDRPGGGEQDWPDHTDPEWLHYQYWILKRSQAKMAEGAGVARSTVSYHMDKNDIPTRDLSKATSLAKGGDERLWDEKWLRERYNEGDKLCEIADILGVSDCTVLKAMERFGIERRDRSEASRIGYQREYGDKEYNDPEWLHHQHHKLGKSTYQIAEENGWNRSVVSRAFERHGMKPRSQRAANLLRWKKEKCPVPVDEPSDGVSSDGIDAAWSSDLADVNPRECFIDFHHKPWLQEKVDEGLTDAEIADESDTDVTRWTIQNWRHHYGIHRDENADAPADD